MDLNIVGFLYLFLRLAPFILVCFFTLSSIFNQDFKGIVYLIGLIFACFVTATTSALVGISYHPTENEEICNLIPLALNSNSISNLPLGETVYGYTFAYLLYIIVKNNIVGQNIPTIVFFPFIILFDMVWNVNNNCSSISHLAISLAVGVVCGLIWAAIINSTSDKSTLLYFSGVNQTETCSKASQQTFRCQVYKNGQLITGQMS
jgi:hypothetical protein